MTKLGCSVDDCAAQAKTRGLCGKHDQRLRRHGSVSTVKPKGGLRPGSLNTEEKFWAKVSRGADAECWPWKLRGDKDGYGHTRWHGSRCPSHRLAFWFTHGFLPEVVMHTCDNPPCCNPTHLVAGTQKANTEDRTIKKRSVHGERVNTAKLTEDKVRDIRSRDVSGRGSKAALSREFGITKTSLGLILSGRHWKHVK